MKCDINNFDNNFKLLLYKSIANSCRVGLLGDTSVTTFHLLLLQ
jgi:hypothetical protein